MPLSSFSDFEDGIELDNHFDQSKLSSDVKREREHLYETRQSFFRQLHDPSHWTILFWALLGMTVMAQAMLFRSSQSFFPELISWNLRRSTSTSSFGISRNSRTKVWLIVADGLGYEDAMDNSDFQSFITSPSIAPHSQIFPATCQSPTASFPNWVTLLTGARPEFHGVQTNEAREVTSDNLFTSCRRFGVSRAVVGTWEWSTLFGYALEPLKGNGIISPLNRFDAATPSTAFTTDELAEKTFTAVVEQSTDFIVLHLGKSFALESSEGIVDDHLGTKESIDKLTAALWRISRLADNSTAMIVVGDHG